MLAALKEKLLLGERRSEAPHIEAVVTPIRRKEPDTVSIKLTGGSNLLNPDAGHLVLNDHVKATLHARVKEVAMRERRHGGGLTKVVVLELLELELR